MENIALNILLDHKDYAFRAWPQVPRCGELISLNDKDSGKPRLAEVARVVWGVREQTVFGKQLEVDVYVSWWDQPKSA